MLTQLDIHVIVVCRKKVHFIKKGNNLLMGAKIKQIRRATGITQKQVADELSITGARLSQIENDDDRYGSVSPDILLQIKKILGVEELPLTDIERDGFKVLLTEWNDLISNRKIEEAKEMRERLSVITFAPFDEEFNALFSLHSSRLEMCLGNYKTAEKILDSIVSEDIIELTDELRYCYYRNKCTLCYFLGQYQDSLDFIKKAFELRTSVKLDIGLYLALAMNYCCVGQIFRSIMILENALELCVAEQNSVYERHINMMLAHSYIGINFLPQAKRVIDRLYAEAQDVGNKQFLCDALVFYGYMYRRGESYSTAHSHLNEGLKHVDKESSNYLDLLYQKAGCYIIEGGVTVGNELVEKGKQLSEGDRHYTILFNSLGHLATISEPESVEYLETVTIPHLLNEIPVYTVALEYCEYLQKHYEQKQSAVKKVYEIEKIMNRIYRKIFEGGEIE